MPCEPGDTIYVRETWCDDRQFTREATPGRYFYKASEEDGFTVKWHPSIHMPKEAARIWLKVTNVRVERLQDITSEQICKEGVEVEEPYVLNGEEKRYAFSSSGTPTSRNPTLTATGGMRIRGFGLLNLSGARSRKFKIIKMKARIIFMNKKDVLEIKRRFRKEACTFTRMCGCYVDADHNKITKIGETFLNLDDAEYFKYLDIAKKRYPAR